MKTIEIYFKKKKSASKNSIQAVQDLCDSYRRNGQIYKSLWPIAEKPDGISVFVNTPENDSLDVRYSNKHVKSSTEGLQKAGLELPEIKLLGSDPEGDEICNCSNSSFYYLRTSFEQENESPLNCGDCHLRVPLYRIPPTDEHNTYQNILRWQYEYVIYDTLHILSTVGERLGYTQLVKYDSELSKEGIDICKLIAKLTKKTVYYYLYKYYGKSNNNELKRKCPSCKGDWLLDKPLFGVIDFKCDKCFLISNVGWDVRK